MEQFYKRIDKEDGTIIFRPVATKEKIESNISLSKCSARIGQAIRVVLTMRDLGCTYSDAVRVVAESLDIHENSVRDKCERQFLVSAQKIQELLNNYFSGDTRPLIDLFTKFVGRNTEKEDLSAINQYL